MYYYFCNGKGKKQKKLINNKKYNKITLLGQNVNSYGKDLYDNYSFANLLEDVCKIKGDFKLTFMTSHPKDLTKEVIDVMAKEDKILDELHLPLQSASNKILKSMNRRYTVEQYLSIIDYLRLKIPNCRLTSDFIVGFPGETEEDCMETYNTVKKIKYNGIFAFMYSIRTGTIAENFENQIDLKTKKNRVNRLLNLQKDIQKGKI